MSQEAYPHLFKRSAAVTNAVKPTTDESEQTIPFVPLFNQAKEESKNSDVIDAAVVEKLGRDPLLRLKAMDYTMKFLVGRPTNVENLGELFDTIYEKLKNGTKQRSKIR